MPINNYSYRDSLGKCDQTSHLYGSSVGSSTPSKVGKTVMTRDVIVSSQEKIDKQVEERFKKETPTGFLLFMSILGKISFFIVIFPSYFVIYALPKWLAMELFPRAFEELKKGWDKMTALILNLVVQATRKALRPFKRLQVFAQARFRKGIERLRIAFERIKTRVETLGRFAKERTLDPVRQFAQRSAQAFSDFFSTSQGGIKQKFENIRHSAAKIVKAIASKSRSLIAPQPVVTLLKSFKQWMDVKSRDVLGVLKNENMRTKAKAEKIVEKIKETLKPYAETALQKIQEAQQKVVQVFQQITFQLKEWSVPRLKGAWSVVREFNQAIKERVIEGLAKCVEWSKLGIQWGKIQLAPAFQIASNMAQNFLRLLPQTIASWLSEGKEIGHKFFKQLQKTLKFLTLKALSLKHKMVAAAQAFYRFLKRSWERGKNTYREGKKKLSRIAKKAMNLTLHLIERGTVWTIRLILWLRLLFAWMRVLTWYGMELLPELTSRILKKCRS